jgi:putative ABC transport system permease protein
MGIRLIAGRGFTDADTLDGTPTMVLDEVLARRYFGSENPLGRAVKIGTSASKEPWRTVVGIVNTVMNDGVDHANRGQIYISYRQMTLDRFAVVAKATHANVNLGAAMRAAVREVDPEQAVYDVFSLSELIGRTTRPREFSLVLMALFAATALALASLGVYAVISWGVSQRTREIGVRMALGADSGSVLRMVLREAGGVALAGTVAGLAGAAALSALMKSMLFRVDAFDPAAFTTAAAVVVAATILAAVVPARRAALLDPCSAIRSE